MGKASVAWPKPRTVGLTTELKAKGEGRGGPFLLCTDTNISLEKHELEHSLAWVWTDCSQNRKEENKNPVSHVDDHTETDLVRGNRYTQARPGE